MAETHDFDRLRKKRRRMILLRRFAILFAVLLAVLGILSLNNILVEFGSAGRMSDFFQGFGGNGYPIPMPGGALRDIRALDSDIVLTNDTSLYIYNNRGKEMLTVQHNNESTILLTGGSRTMTYAVGSAGYNIYSRSKLLLEGDNGNAITTAAMSRRGDYAIVAATQQYAAQVTVYDIKFDQSFQWSSSELVATVAIGPKGGKLAAGCVGASGGVLNSSVLLFSFDSQSAVARLEMPDELVLKVEYLTESFVGILTDRGFHIVDGQGRILSTTSFGGEQLVAGRFDAQGNTLLLTESTESRTQTLRLIDSSGTELGKIHPQSTIRDLQVGQRSVYLLTDSGLLQYDRSLALTETHPLSGANRILIVGNRIYYFTAEEICIME